ncbi:MAG TPA: hypothetical protein VMV79_03150 [Alphaproteobacteria bacterium]|nr:hypothetical protein [Alphaproteobacteria bacterium]
MAHAALKTVRITATVPFRPNEETQTAAGSRRHTAKIISLQQLREVFATSDLLTEGERQAGEMEDRRAGILP